MVMIGNVSIFDPSVNPEYIKKKWERIVTCHCDRIPEKNSLKGESYFGFRGFSPWFINSVNVDPEAGRT